jgi:hypothetical protein
MNEIRYSVKKSLKLFSLRRSVHTPSATYPRAVTTLRKLKRAFVALLKLLVN